MKSQILIFSFFVIGLNLFAQNIKLGAGFSLDMGLGIEKSSNYKPVYGNSTMLMSMDVFTKIPIKKQFNIYPSVIFTVVKSIQIELEDTKGDIRPDGDLMQVPYSTVGHGWTVYRYGNKYEYYLSEGYISQTSVGSFISRNITSNFEIGSGAFLKIKKVEIQHHQAYDKYYWSGSMGTQYDNYSYLESIVSQYDISRKENYIIKRLSIPVWVQYSGNVGIGFSFLAYFGEDTYFSLRVLMAFGLKK